MEYQATGKYLRISTRKMRLVADSIRGFTYEEAVKTLTHMNKHGAEVLLPVILSAGANAKGKQQDVSTLMVKTLEIMGGSGMKRWHAVSKGTAHAYKKRMTHVRVILEEKEQKKELK